MRALLLSSALLSLAAFTAQAQSAEVSQRQWSLQMSRYEQMIGRLQQENERLMRDIRTLQRGFEAVQKQAQAAEKASQNLSDQWLKFENEQGALVPWGTGQRACPELSAQHQDLKVQMSPDGGESVRFLCFDGKGLYLGSETYRLGKAAN